VSVLSRDLIAKYFPMERVRTDSYDSMITDWISEFDFSVIYKDNTVSELHVAEGSKGMSMGNLELLIRNGIIQ